MKRGSDVASPNGELGGIEQRYLGGMKHPAGSHGLRSVFENMMRFGYGRTLRLWSNLFVSLLLQRRVWMRM